VVPRQTDDERTASATSGGSGNVAVTSGLPPTADIEAARYLMLGSGEGQLVIPTSSTWGKPIEYPMDHISNQLV
jgi:hypothetical protein